MNQYDLSAKYYEKRYRKIQYSKYTQLFSEFVRKGRVVLDVGCGTGLVAEFLFENTEKREISHFSLVGVDISDNMLKEFREKKEQLDFSSNSINLVQADLEHLPLRANKFNTLISITSYQNLPNIKLGINESVRASKNRAEAYISVLRKSISNSQFLDHIEDLIDDIQIIDNQSIEDLMIKGTVKKPESPKKSS